MNRVFVYGTLRRGERNHGQIAGALLLGPARAIGYELLDMGPYPGMRLGRGVVHGELYAVDDARLAQLDEFEGHPHLFTRTELTLADGSRAFSWLWNGPPRGTHITSGDYAARAGVR
ncbi:MAG: gamma-glutamylcyclotransferase [Myxococcales bacterium]|nr:gamma-glutamylcyclotransferase [Myxococcales bacterium]MBL8721009.1 gamma-glutamylcyclotransferase [Myxococcales bacterium]